MDLEINVSELIGVLDFYGRVLDTITVTERVNLEIVWHLELQPGPGTGTDTLIYSANANTDYGAFVRINSGSELATVHHRGIVKFDLSSIPANSTIRLASAKLYCETEASTTDRTVNFHRSLVQWFEGSGSAVTPPVGDASVWNYKNYNGSVAWGAAGGQANTDYVSSATAGVSITGTGVVFSWNVIADIQRFADGAATNYGWWLINASQGTANSYKGFTSSAGATTANRPLIIVEWRDSITINVSDTVTVSESTPMWVQEDGFHQIFTQPDAATGLDTYMYQSSTSANYGTAIGMIVGKYVYIYRGLLQFDLSSVTIGSTFVNCYVDLYCYDQQDTSTQVVQAHQMLKQWFEGNQNGGTPPAGVDGSTWNYRNYNGLVAWGAGGGQAGVDYVSAAADTETVTGTGKWIRFDLSSMGQDWCNGENYGVLLRLTNESTNYTYKVLASSDYATPTLRPRITFTYRDSIYINVSDSVTVTESVNDPIVGYVVRLVISGTPTYARDTYINSLAANTNYGSSADIYSDVDAIQNGLIRFDLSQIPTDVSIQSASLRIYLFNVFAGISKPTYIYRSLVEWDESAATWNFPWSTPGGAAGVDYYTYKYSGYAAPVLNGQYYLFPGLGNDVKGMVAGELPNYGWWIVNSTGSWEIWSSSESAAIPYLWVEWLGTSLPIAVMDSVTVSESESLSETLAALETITVTEDSDVFVEPAPVGLARTYTVFIA